MKNKNYISAILREKKILKIIKFDYYQEFVYFVENALT
jgi:hypothetical protein